MSETIMKIPDALLAWGRSPEVESRLPRPWASIIAKMITDAGDTPILGRDRTKLLSHLEALCVEAIRAGRPELLDGLDTRTAETLGIEYTIEADGKKITIGNKGRYSWDEMRAVLANDDPKEALRQVERAKDLLGDVFPGARVGLVHRDDDEPEPCASCGTTTSRVMMLSESGASYCGKCWLTNTDETPYVTKYKRSKRPAAASVEDDLLTRSGR